ncbi:hypothetical protein GCM10011579_067850 [Streptomyces albiflavescens]|uniref:Uncharacterized protein n=2 Tax=Streptomyces albiflavescens TaxID=1623582 RepID=A0A917Y9P9_9ACTN|nr:hypothetical protein GCM10011579_067850 [Streptomyces albiflavescens]
MTGRRRERANQRPRVERITSWSTVLRSMNREQAETFLACALYGTTPKELSHALGQRWTSAFLGRSGAVYQAYRHSLSLGVELLSSWFPEGGDTIVIDEDLRALIREWRIEERFAPRCRQCDVPFARRAKGGRRPREYCSNACRQKAYRRRNAAVREADDVRECHTPDEVDRALREGREVVMCEICQPGYPSRHLMRTQMTSMYRLWDDVE